MPDVKTEIINEIKKFIDKLPQDPLTLWVHNGSKNAEIAIVKDRKLSEFSEVGIEIADQAVYQYHNVRTGPLYLKHGDKNNQIPHQRFGDEHFKEDLCDFLKLELKAGSSEKVGDLITRFLMFRDISSKLDISLIDFLKNNYYPVMSKEHRRLLTRLVLHSVLSLKDNPDAIVKLQAIYDMAENINANLNKLQETIVKLDPREFEKTTIYDKLNYSVTNREMHVKAALVISELQVKLYDYIDQFNQGKMPLKEFSKKCDEALNHASKEESLKIHGFIDSIIVALKAAIKAIVTWSFDVEPTESMQTVMGMKEAIQGLKLDGDKPDNVTPVPGNG